MEKGQTRESLVSVVLPTYNRAASLGRAVSSVLAQTHENLELVVVDDGSTDGTRKLLDTIADPRLVIIALEQNAGQAQARNRGIAAARGEWIAFQDSDDEWCRDKLEKQLVAGIRDSADMVVSEYKLSGYSEETRVAGRSKAVVAGDFELDVLSAFSFITPTWLIRREVLSQVGGFDDTYQCWEDWDLALRIVTGTRLTCVQECLVIKHQEGEGLDSDPHRQIHDYSLILDRHGDKWRDYEKILSQHRERLGHMLFQYGHEADAELQFVEACVVYPLNLRAQVYRYALRSGGAWYRRTRRLIQHSERMLAPFRSHKGGRRW